MCVANKESFCKDNSLIFSMSLDLLACTIWSSISLIDFSIDDFSNLVSCTFFLSNLFTTLFMNLLPRGVSIHIFFMASLSMYATIAS